MKIASPKAVRKRLAEYAQRPIEWEATKGDRGALVGAFNDALQDVPGKLEKEHKRYLVWGFCFTPDDQPLTLMRSESLYDGHIFALKKWVGFYKDDKDEWQQREEFCMEVRQIFALASMFHALDKKGDPMTMGEWLAGLEEAIHEIEKSGMVQSAVDDLGGVVTATGGKEEVTGEWEPPAGYIPL